MWIYRQTNGSLLYDNWTLVGTGYSGRGEGKNNPFFDTQHNVGPLPRGIYMIGEPRDTPMHGPFVLPLTPDPRNDMHGRSAFLIHGDSLTRPGEASDGCIVLPRAIRERVAKALDQRLVVIA